MINKQAITRFLGRKLDDWDWLKRETVEELDAALAALKPVPVLPDLWAHQKVCFLILELLQRFMLHIDMGGGKSLISLSMLSYAKQRGDKVKAIVFVPYITAVETWIDETAKHMPHLVCVPLTGSTKNNLHKLQHAQGDIFVMCYQSAIAMLAEPAKGKSKKRKWTITAERTRAVFDGFNMLIMDEIHRCKKASSLTYRMCRAISAQAEWVIGLTGTPFGRDLADLWPQFYLIDFGDTLGPTLEFYKAVFFKEKVNYFGAYEYTFNKKLFPDLKRIIKHSSIRYAIDDLHDMPPKVYRRMRLDAPDGIKGYAEKAIENIKASVNNGLKGKAGYREVESEYLKLRQLSSGFMTLRGEDNDKVQVAFDKNPKLDLLEEFLEDIPYTSKFIVFHHFIYTNGLISARLDKMKIKHARVYGKTRDPIAELRRFKTDPACRGLVLNSKSGSSSLNLQMANYAIFFEQPDSAIDRQQAERRIWRPGQEKRVNIVDFLMRGTADDKLHAANKAGKNLLQALLDGKDSF